MVSLQEKCLIPLLLTGAYLSIIIFCEGFMRQCNTLKDFSKGGGNPYLKEMVFENKEQEDKYHNNWFPIISEQVVVYLVDSLPYYMAVPGIQESNRVTESKNNTVKDSLDNQIAGEDQNQTIQNENISTNLIQYKDGRLKSISKLMRKEPNNCVLLCAIVEGVTWTESRVKALSTGSIPGSLDMVHKMGSLGVTEDNIFYQLHKDNQATYIYGDHCWVTLFGAFLKDWVLTSGVWDSFVTHKNFQEQVAAKMNQASQKNQNNLKWDFLLYHDGILDSMLHFKDLFSYPDFQDNPTFNETLDETDAGIDMILTNSIENMTVFIISDHGFSRTGAHGGMSIEEQSSLLFAYNKNGFIQNRNIQQQMNKLYYNSTVDQIDFTATFCMLKGIPIPVNNIGVIIPDFFVDLPWVTNTVIANAYFTNIRQIEDYFIESHRLFSFPVKRIFENIESQFQVAHKLYKQLSTTSLIKDEQLFQYISQVRYVASLVKTTVAQGSTFNFDQMILAAITQAILILFAFLQSLRLDASLHIPNSGIKKVFCSRKRYVIYTIIIVLWICSSTLLHVWSAYLSLLGFLNIFIVGILLIGIVEMILLQVSFSHPYVSFIGKVTLADCLLLFMTITIALILSSNDFFYSIDSHCLLILAIVLSALTIKSIIDSLKNQLCSFKVLIKNILRAFFIILSVDFAIYFDPSIQGQGQSLPFKLYMYKPYAEYFALPIYHTTIPLVLFGVFYAFRIKREHFPNQLFRNVIYGLHTMQYILLASYFGLRKDYPNNVYFFENFFPLLIYLLIIIQVLFLAFNKTQLTFYNKYCLVFWSLLPPLLILMESCSIMQTVIFFMCISLFQDFLSEMNPQGKWLIYAFTHTICWLFYRASGHGFKFEDVDVRTSQIGTFFFTDLQTKINSTLANFGWFVLGFLYFPIIFFNQYFVKHTNNSLKSISVADVNYQAQRAINYSRTGSYYVSSSDDDEDEEQSSLGDLQKNRISQSEFTVNLIKSIIQFSLPLYPIMMSIFIRCVVKAVPWEDGLFIFLAFFLLGILIIFTLIITFILTTHKRLYSSLNYNLKTQRKHSLTDNQNQRSI